MTKLDITPEPSPEERAAIEAALAAAERPLPPPAWVEESEQLEP